VNTGKIIFVLSGIIIFSGTINVLIIHYKSINYVKNKYPQKWKDEIRYGMMSIYGTLIFNYFKDTDDPVLIDYKKKYYSACSRLMLYALIVAILVFGYALYFESTLPRPFSR